MYIYYICFSNVTTSTTLVILLLVTLKESDYILLLNTIQSIMTIKKYNTE